MVLVYFFAVFFPVFEEGIVLELRGTSKSEDAQTEALGGGPGAGGMRAVCVPRPMCASANSGVWSSLASGGGCMPEDSSANEGSISGDCVTEALEEAAESCTAVSMGGNSAGGEDARSAACVAGSPSESPESFVG